MLRENLSCDPHATKKISVTTHTQLEKKITNRVIQWPGFFFLSYNTCHFYKKKYNKEAHKKATKKKLKYTCCKGTTKRHSKAVHDEKSSGGQKQ
jgi:hypothetical protein